MKSLSTFTILTALLGLCFFNRSAFPQDTTPPKILKLNYFPGSYDQEIIIHWQTNEPVGWKIYYSYRTDQVSNPDEFKTEGEITSSLPGQKNSGDFYIEFIDQTGNITKSPIFEVCRYAYLRGHININEGALTTNSRTVTLSLRAIDPEFEITQMRFSNDDTNWSNWETFAQIKSWQLSEGEGLKTVYVKFKNSKGLFTTFPSSDSIYYTTQKSSSNISSIQIKNRQLFVQRSLPNDKKTALLPYKIKGVCWSPASIGNLGYFNDITTAKEEFKKWYVQDIALMKEMGINTVRTYIDFGEDAQVFKAVLDELHHNGIMAIMAVDDCRGDSVNLERVISNFKDHPAILAWQIGNGWNKNRYWKFSFEHFKLAISLTEQLTKKIKQLDYYHPIISILGDAESFIIPSINSFVDYCEIEDIVSRNCPAVDIWGINGDINGSFSGLFYKWSEISLKPMFVSEAGIDIYDHRINNENPQMQADFDAGLWDELYFRLSADRPNEPCLGITFFEWNDEWWRNGHGEYHDLSSYNSPFSYSYPDNMGDIEYFGILDINRVKRQGYFVVGDRYKKQGQLFLLSRDINLKIISSGPLHFFKNNQRFSKYAGLGGFNFVIVDPKTGLVEQERRFNPYDLITREIATNTYAVEVDQGALSHMVDFINNVPNGKIIIAGVGHGSRLDPNIMEIEPFYKTLESIGSTLIRNVGFRDTWAMISIKGKPGNLAEDYKPFDNSNNDYLSAEAEANINLDLDVDKDGITDNIDTDRDNDGLTDTQEAAKSTDPLDKDTDDDGLLDNVDPVPALAAIPEIVSINPAYGTSQPNLPVTFTAVFKDLDGWKNIAGAYLLLNTSQNAANCVYAYYDQNSNKIYLRNDADTAWVGGYIPGTSKTIENSYVKLNCLSSTVLGSGNTLTVRWNVSFKSAFTGSSAKNIYVYVNDDSNAIHGWVQKGTYVVGSNIAPVVGSITPASGEGIANSAVNFTTTYSDTNGWQNIAAAQILVNTSTATTSCFYGYYDQNTNKLYLRNDYNTAWLGGFEPGVNKVIENSYAKIDCSSITVSGSGNSLTIKWAVTFKSKFTGAKNTYLYVKDDLNAANGWVKKGSWSIK